MKILLSLFLSSVGLWAADAFVSADYVEKNLKNSKVVLIDVGTKKDYLAGHIPGAINTSISQWRMQKGPFQLMQTSKKIEKLIRSLGVNSQDHVVIYGHNKPKELLKSSYISLAFIVNGHKNISILDGGYEEWIYDEERKIEKKLVAKKAGNFKATFNKNVLVNRGFVEKNLHKIPMIEARPTAFYFGKLQSKGVKRMGHIAGAMSYTWANSFQADKTVLETSELKEILIDGMQLNPNKEMLAYCTGGLEASMNWYILTQSLKFKDVKIYDASMREWGNRTDTPMVRYRWEQFAK